MNAAAYSSNRPSFLYAQPSWRNNTRKGRHEIKQEFEDLNIFCCWELGGILTDHLS
jgi:hypothetical protein